MGAFLAGLAVLPTLALLWFLASWLWADRRRLSFAARRLARRRMVRRLPYPDPEWRRSATCLRYRAGIALLRPYLDRMLRFHLDLSERRDPERWHFARWCALDDVVRLRSEVGFGEYGMSLLQSPPGWPRRFHILRWWR